MEALREVRAREYLAGASLALGVVVLTLQALGIYYTQSSIEERSLEELSEMLLQIFLSTHIVGGFLGSYLVTRRRTEKIFRAAIFTSITAYIIEYAYHLIFEGSFGGSLLALIGLLTGSIISVLLTSLTRRGAKPFHTKSDKGFTLRRAW